MATAVRRTDSSFAFSAERRRVRSLLSGLALIPFALLAGCGEEPAAQSKGSFSVAGENADDVDAAPRAEGDGAGAASSALRDRIDAAEAAAPGSPDASAVAPPPSLAMDDFKADPVPANATAPELVQYLKTTAARQQELQQRARGMTEQEFLGSVAELQRNRIEAAAALLIAEDAEDNARQMAIDETLRAYDTLEQTGQDVQAARETFLAEHAADRDPIISRYVRSMSAYLALAKLAGQEPPSQEESDAALAQVDALLADVEPNRQTLSLLSGAVGDLASMDRLDLANQVIAKLDAEYAGVEDPQLQEAYKNNVGGAKASVVSVALQKIAAQENPPQEQIDSALAELDQLLASGPASAATYQAVDNTAALLIEQGRTELAATIYQKLGDTYVKLEDPNLKQGGEIALIRAKLTALDVAKLLAEVGGGDDEPANRLVEVAQQLVSESTPPPIGYLGILKEFAETLEYVRKYDASRNLYQLIADAYGSHPEAEAAAEANEISQGGLKRLSLIGQKLDLQGESIGGVPFEWDAYRGKVVLVDFWATWCQPCLAEIPNVAANYRKFKGQGFEVVGVNLDEDPQAAQQFLGANPLPWANIASSFQSPLAVQYGIERIPFVVLVDREGVVIDIHVRGPFLAQRLEELLGPPAGGAPAPNAGQAAPIQEVPAPEGSNPEASTPEGAAPATPPAEMPAGEAPAPGGGLPELEPLRSSAIDNAFDDGVFFVSAPADAASQDDEAAPAAEEEEPLAPHNDADLFAAPPDLTLEELVDYLFDMEEKPRSVQALKGFDDAMIDACDRIWRHPDATVPQLRLAATTKFARLHRAGTMGNAKADDALAVYAERVAETPDEAIGSWVELVRLEREAVAGDTLSADMVPDLLAKLMAYFERTQAEERHLRLASLTVRLINRIDDPTADEELQKELAAKREEQYKSFGDLFAKSDNKDLARYGKKLAKPPAAQESDLVGKPLELEGELADGGTFDWASYRGKVVIVDFWATWCGPCRREMPHVKEAYEKFEGQGFEVVGISLDEDQEALAEYLEENQIEWATLVGDSAFGLAERYGVRGIPTMILVDRDGNVVMSGHQAQPLIDKAAELLAAK